MKKIILIIILLTILSLAGFFGGRAIYDGGVKDGRRVESEEMSDNLNALGKAVSDKENFQKELSTIFSDVPSEINSEGIDSYIEKLSNLIGEVSVESVKSTLEEYLNKWQSFKEVYAGENNNEITEKFNELKMTAGDLSGRIKNIFDESIKDALEAL